ncbi:DCC1-like thiol-disulfide oxidoreductase family protein [Hyphococcus flavus]|uniref:DCC1-like thiol-disulfide oxidoreductase family protein n=1 Tax=Hyphococcus flavus TaxID=1866326 RepID=A0AAE9ZC93_9PROT|nr:DCC1-like thiol-disulfide oxidoreductase family protein [Hyphococcus flavus]WDI30800.1 DCC1-like thiol-disulfide oxidoreductase family protein [Hyphococcus flavus]
MQPEKYSYRDDPNVPPFDDSKPLIIFDGVCVLCASGVQFMMKHDRQGETRFAVIQDALPRALYKHYDLDADTFDTFMVLADGVPHLRWRGVCKAARLMPAPWKWLGALGRLVPGVIGDAVYDFVQRNRIGWFGSRDVCFVPDAETKKRFLARL